MSLSDGLVRSRLPTWAWPTLSRTANEDLTAVLTSAIQEPVPHPSERRDDGDRGLPGPRTGTGFPQGRHPRGHVCRPAATHSYLLTGRPPFAGTTLAEKLIKHQQAEPPPIDKLASQVPQALVLVDPPDAREKSRRSVTGHRRKWPPPWRPVLNIAGLPLALAAAPRAPNSRGPGAACPPLAFLAGNSAATASLHCRGVVPLLGLVGLTLASTGRGGTPRGVSVFGRRNSGRRQAFCLPSGRWPADYGSTPEELSRLASIRGRGTPAAGIARCPVAMPRQTAGPTGR